MQTETPAQLGYTFPPEWRRHAATWMSWPRPAGISFPNRYDECSANVARVIAAIAARERVHLNVGDDALERIAREKLHAADCPADPVAFERIPTNEPWCRDHGPAFVVRENREHPLAVVDWKFNAWGGKYPPWDDDDAVPLQVAEKLGLRLFRPDLHCEGGGIEVNGAGTLMTTESCLLNASRNPNRSRDEVETYLRDYYGQRHIVWLGEGIAGDDTDGHIDTLARFISPTTVVIGTTQDRTDENFEPLQANLERLRTARDQDGRPFRIIEMPMPRRMEHDDQRLPATYMNFYFVNDALLVPTFDDEANDADAMSILRRELPDRKVVGVDCSALIWGLGAIHCLTQQQPAASRT